MKAITIRAGKNIIKADYADDFFSRIRGLMFSAQLKNKGLLIECLEENKISSAIHMLFVFFPIDVLWLNSQKEIVDIKSVFPFTPLIIPRKPAKYILELPAGYAARFKVGEKLRF